MRSRWSWSGRAPTHGRRTPRQERARPQGLFLSGNSTPSAPAQPGCGAPVPVDKRIALAPRPPPPPPPSQRRPPRARECVKKPTGRRSQIFPPRRQATGRAEGQSAKLHAASGAPPGGHSGKGLCSGPSCASLGLVDPGPSSVSRTVLHQRWERKRVCVGTAVSRTISYCIFHIALQP